VPDPDRHRRIAVNESRFREINDRLAEGLGSLRHPPEHLDFVCECAHLECRAKVSLTAAEYERVRADPMLFAIVDGHEVPDTEDVVARADRFTTVRKHRDVEDIVTATDPRAT
jgi:hypothetical protein